MTTFIIYSDPNDGYLKSTSTSYATAVAGAGLTSNTTETTVRTGMNVSTSGVYSIYEGFWSFDTSVIPDTDEVVDATINMHLGYLAKQAVWWDMEFRGFNWTAPLSTTQWKSPATLRTYPLRAAFDFISPDSTYRTRATGADTLYKNINKTAPMKFISVSNRMLAGNVPTGVEEMWAYSADSTGKPYMTVYTVAPNTLNSVSEASTTLPDGTTVSVRSNGAATPVLTVGYNTLGSSTWTSLGTLDAKFTKDIDGANSIAMTSDPAGNFYIFGVLAGSAGSLVGQAYKKTGATSWTAMTPLSQAMPIGNEQTIKSIAALYMKGGSTPTDKPSIHLVLARGASGVNLNYRYHVSGAGLTQNAQIKPENMLAGSGALINASAGWNPAACGIPAFVDVVPVTNNINAVYVQRAKIHNTVVGGLSMVYVNNQSGAFREINTDYVSTGASQLVPINDAMFAHVFDQEGLKLTVRIYNSHAQIIGETSIPKENFYGSTIGNQFAAYYDKTANLVRVFYVDVASSNTLSRLDVSPVTYSGTVVTGVVTSFGAAASINTDLRISRTTDERRVMIEAANSAAGVLSTVTAFSTVGNVVPNAPALTTRPNFDATSAATFTWIFSDPNPADAQTAYQLEISRVSDSVVVYDSGKVTSAIGTATLAANVLANAIDYRWRVRTYDTLNATGTWSGYGTFSTSATGTLTITSPATDNVTGIDTDDYAVTWSYVQAGGATQTQRRVRLIRTADSAVISDTTMQANTSNTYTIVGMETGKEYRVEVTIVNSSAITTPVVSRLITPNYSQPMTPSLEITLGEEYVELIAINPVPSGDRPEVIFNDIYKRRTKVNSVDSDFVRIATIGNSSAYRDYAVKSGTSYDYRVVGRTV